ncbi:hypothetical protein IE077_004285 [Cardiosporidium cionae]|uniref:Uncharacterized protein n=1 Tax=Cardiosporidium cionae TaxID=476202 RepID=A0ABQ7J515_9APIC|nr:hypothetical protein IE077_004285 [Cardiosporidium cionae]|eukprot:KAF8819106.1 hypothetical protein IE077_004285 [Cardiosporidium cionae]
MTLRSPATAADFPHFVAWYGCSPTFDLLASPQYRLSCRDEWYVWRVAGINAISLPRLHHAKPDQLNSLCTAALADVLQCHRIKRLPPTQRPAAWKARFDAKFPINDVWTYRVPPTHPLHEK